jgi:hypothetical protein
LTEVISLDIRMSVEHMYGHEAHDDLAHRPTAIQAQDVIKTHWHTDCRVDSTLR